MDVIRWAVTASFVLLAATGLRLWWRGRGPTMAWLVAMFSSLAAVRLAGHLLPSQATGLTAAAGVALLAALVAFPYLLFRFTESFRPVGWPWRALAAVLTVAAVGATVVVFAGIGLAGMQSRWMTLFVLAVMAFWTGLTGWAVWRLWRAGRHRPTVTRRRMWTMAAAAGLLNASLLLLVFGSGQALALSSEVVAFASAVAFLLAFAPPRSVRLLWRQPDERALWHAEADLVSADTREAVVTAVLPHAARLLGGEGAMFIDRAGQATSEGLDEVGRAHVRRQLAAVPSSATGATLSEGVAALPLRQGRLGVATTVYAPVFGRDEIDLMERLGGLLDLALSRAQLYDLERAARESEGQARRRADAAKAKAEAASAELEALLYGITHDLRNPIVSVRGYLDCLTEDHADRLDEEGRHFLSRLHSNAQYMDQLVGDLLRLSRAGTVGDRPAEVDLRAVAEQVAAELRAAHPGAVIEVDDLPRVAIEPARARQVLTNLMTNAVVHAGRPDARLRVAAAPSDEPRHAAVAITDNGPGIPAADRQRAFELFRTLRDGDSAVRTSGIGLAITRRIVENAGGRVWIEDSEEGADVRFRLPVAARQLEAP